VNFVIDRLTDEQRDFVAAINDFCQREAGDRERRAKLTDGGKNPHSAELYEKMADLGWLGITVPEQYGGAGQAMIDLVLFLESTAYWQAPIYAFVTSAIAAASYQKFAVDVRAGRGLGRGRPGLQGGTA
jgi:isovaleryl-CoA dehydrogenase